MYINMHDFVFLILFIWLHHSSSFYKKCLQCTIMFEEPLYKLFKQMSNKLKK